MKLSSWNGFVLPSNNNHDDDGNDDEGKGNRVYCLGMADSSQKRNMDKTQSQLPNRMPGSGSAHWGLQVTSLKR